MRATIVVNKIISGGQTGADRAGLDVARSLGIATGGWVPRGRRAEDGVVPAYYENLREAESRSYAVRTKLNVRDSDATVIFTFGRPARGTALTERTARALGRPVLCIDLLRCTVDAAVATLRQWLAAEQARVLNVAGERDSEDSRIGGAVAEVLSRALARSGSRPP